MNIMEGAVISCGLDLVDTARISSMLERHGDEFLARTFCDFEIEYCSKFANSAVHYAARFAAKEAVVKALKTGFSGDITLKSAGVINDAKGAPEIVLDAAASARLKELGASKILISLTHLKDYAQAIAIAVK